MAESLTKWRERHAEDFNRMAKLEKRGQELRLPEGCAVYPWGIGWSVDGGGEHDLADFVERVRQMTEILGPPDQCSGSIDTTKLAQLTACWSTADTTVYVQTVHAKGCKVDPRETPTPTVWGSPGKLHPECQAVLAELGG